MIDAACVISALLLVYNQQMPVEFGASLIGGVDLDGDGTPDLAVGAPGTEGGAGSVVVLSGRTLARLATFEGERANERFGTGVQMYDDWVGDGSPGLIACGPGSKTCPGVVRCYSGLGKAPTVVLDEEELGSGFGAVARLCRPSKGEPLLIVSAPTVSRSGEEQGAILVYSLPHGNLVRTIHGEVRGERFGLALDVGDYDGDGTEDLFVGAPGGLGRGRIVVISGSNWLPLITIEQGPLGSGFGSAVTFADDLNGDGIRELLIGSPRSGAWAERGGAAHVLSGKSGEVLFSLTTDRRDHEYPGWLEAEFGSAVTLVGDVNGDGVRDYAVGAPGGYWSGGYTGWMGLFSGQGGGSLAQTAWAPTDEDVPNGYGSALCAIGDVNNDGVIDYAVGAPDIGFSAGGIEIVAGADLSLIQQIR